MNDKKIFDKELTNTIKGIAILLMIWHHLFFNINETISKNLKYANVLISTGYIGKICVPLFCFLSGYGICAKLGERTAYNQIKGFYKKYEMHVILWSAILLVFSNKYNILFWDFKSFIKILLTSSGLQYLFLYKGFNESWWFATQIIFLYVLYKYLYTYMKKYPYLTLILTFLIGFLDIFKLCTMLGYIFPFAIGIFFKQINFFEESYERLIKQRFVIVSMLVILFVYRGSMHEINFWTNRIEWLIILLLVFTCFVFYKDNIITTFLRTFGKYSDGMWYSHMFFSIYYLNGIIYKIKNPIIIFCLTVVLSFMYSFFVTKLCKKLNIC